MNLAVISHKLCWPSSVSPTGYSTDGGFPFQIEAISELFETTTLVVPCKLGGALGAAPLKGRAIKVAALSTPTGRGLRRKLGFPLWLLKNGRLIWREVRNADAIHTPIPGDVGTIGMICALLQRKPLFVRHCGNWLVQRTLAEHFWKWSMETFAGGRNVMFATGGGPEGPSESNPNIRWIFSTSLRRSQMEAVTPNALPNDGRIRFVIACRQEERKGTDVVLESMPAVLDAFPNSTLDVVGDGSMLPKLKQRASEMGASGSVTFHGKLEHPEVLKVFARGHVFCYPTTASEGFPKVVLEALALGMPVITTRVSVLPNLISNGCGILLDSPTPQELAAAAIKLCSDRTGYREMSRQAIEVSKCYCLEDWRDLIGTSLRDSWGAELFSPEAKAGD